MKPFPTKSIEEITDEIIDYRGKTPPKTTSGIKLITAKVIKDGFIVDGNHEFISDDTYIAWMRRGMPQQWDILLTTEAPLGEVCQLRTMEKVALAQRVILLRGNPKLIDQQFFFQALKSPLVQAGLRARATGTTVSGIKQSELRQVQVPIPLLSTQQKIATILSAYDDLIANNTRRIKILEEIAQMLYREWFVNFRFPGHEKVKMVDSEMGKIPAGWVAATIRNATLLITRGISPKYDDKAQEIVINQKCIRDFRLDLFVSRRHATKVPQEKYVRNGDVLLNSTGVGTLGRVAQVQMTLSNCTVDSHVTIVRPKDGVDSDFLGLQLFSLQSHFERQGRGATGQTELNREAIADSPYLDPLKEIQFSFGEIVRPMRQLVIRLLEKNKVLKKTRDLLLPKLISGDVDVEDLDIATAETETALATTSV